MKNFGKKNKFGNKLVILIICLTLLTSVFALSPNANILGKKVVTEKNYKLRELEPFADFSEVVEDDGNFDPKMTGILGGPYTFYFSDVSLTSSGATDSGHYAPVFDLTQCDLTLSFTYDATGFVDNDPSGVDWDDHAWGAFGIREVGYPDFNPTFGSEGAGVWLATDYFDSSGGVDGLKDPTGGEDFPNLLDLDDKLILQKAGGHGEADYNLPTAAHSSTMSHRIWFDRDGVDQWQAAHPLAVDGGTYNTGGTYNIVLTLHATSATAGEAYMTVNGLQQGWEDNGNWNDMEFAPAGMTFTGDMTQQQVYYGLYGYGSTYSCAFTGITAAGCTACADPVYVDDDYAGSTFGDIVDGHTFGYDAFDTIQKGVEAVCECGTVYVAAGTYVEQVTIRDKSLKLIGTDATIQMPSSGVLDIRVAESSAHYKYAVGIWGYDTYNSGTDTISGSSTITVEMSGFTVDNNNFDAGSGYRFCSILCRNVDKSKCDGVANIHDNEIINVYVDGIQTFGILGYGDMNIVIQDNIVNQFGRGGIGMMSGNSEILGNTIIGPWHSATWAANGIQVSYGATGLIQGNDVSRSGWPGSAWAATGILVGDTSNVDIDDNYVHDCEQAIGIGDYPASWGPPWDAATASDITVTNNIIDNNEWGISVFNDITNVLIYCNKVTDTANDGIDVYNYGYGDPSPTNIVINCNDIVGSGLDGLWVGPLVTQQVDATCNWWGANDGPSGAGPGSGDTVIGNALYTPWIQVNADAGGPYSVIGVFTVNFDGSGSTTSGCCSGTLTYDWDFGDGHTGTGINPSHTYSSFGTYTATLTVTSTNICGHSHTDTDSTKVYVKPKPDVEIEKYVWDETTSSWVEELRVPIDTLLNFKIIVTNTGQKDLNNLNIKDEMGIQLQYRDNANIPETSVSPDERTIIWDINKLTVGSSMEITFDVQAVQICFGWNSVIVRAKEPVVAAALVKVKVISPGQPMIDITKEVWDEDKNEWASSITQPMGTDMEFKITVFNTAFNTLHNVVITDNLPDKIKYGYDASVDPETESDQQIIWKFDEIEPGEIIEIIYSAEALEEGITETIAEVTTEEKFYDEDQVLVVIATVPDVDLIYPQGDETLSNTVKIVWEATDESDPYLDIYLYYSDNNGDTWTEVGDVYENNNEYDWDTTLIPDGTYILMIQAENDYGMIETAISDQFEIANTGGSNHAPNSPNIYGPASGEVGTEVEYTISGSDPDGDPVYVIVYWDDETDTGWLGPYISSFEIKLKHTWSEEGSYTIKAKAKDEEGKQSDWGTLQISMPRNRAIQRPFLQFLQNFLENYPILYQLLQRFFNL